MKDIPVFTTQYGVASLVLREIPYTKRAYIRLQDTLQPAEFLEECTSFCSMCGAEQIFSAGNSYLEAFPRWARIVKMSRGIEGLPQANAALFPVLPETVEQWRSLYNTRMYHVPNAAFMSQQDGQEMLKKGDGYFVHREGKLLGIGRASGDRIDAVISAQKGMGQEVLLALCGLITGDTVNLEVAEENLPAVRLYERMGFLMTGELSAWYRVK